MGGVVHVALVHEGKVLVDEDGGLPLLSMDDPEEVPDRFGRALDRVGADVYLAPILRLGEDRYLDVVGCRAVPVPDGRWAGPAAVDDVELAGTLTRTIHEHEQQPPAQRPAWFRRGWYDEVEAWIDAALDRAGRRRTGVIRVFRVWSISAVLQVPTDTGLVWFKAACEVFRAEASIHRVLAAHFPADVPVLVAEDDARGWLLMEPMRGGTEATRAPGAALALAARWPAVQLASLGLRDELLAAGCPVRDADATVAAYRDVLDHSPELAGLSDAELTGLRESVDEVARLVRELWDCGLPDTLSHGDLHLGNVAYDGTELRVFDLTDGCLSHPLLDAWHLACFVDRESDDHALLRAFAEPWRAVFPGADVDRAVRLAGVADLVFQVDTFARIAAATEPASAYELGGVVRWLLRRIPGAVAATR